MEKLNGLDLFSGIAGISEALEKYIRPVAYCEISKYPVGVLLSRQITKQIPVAPIWDDVKTLKGWMLPKVDIVYGGFPCQDISVANPNATGVEGKRSGLFSEILRLAKETKSAFIFLENSPAIRTRGASRVCKELADAGYDCRWCTLAASEVGARHKRKRWYLLAHTRRLSSNQGTTFQRRNDERASDNIERCDTLEYANSKRLERIHEPRREVSVQPAKTAIWQEWETEPRLDRVAHGLPYQVDRLACLGNSVVPRAAKTAFEILMGIIHV